jgi:hypothetical protein
MAWNLFSEGFREYADQQDKDADLASVYFLE